MYKYKWVFFSPPASGGIFLQIWRSWPVWQSWGSEITLSWKGVESGSIREQLLARIGGLKLCNGSAVSNVSGRRFRKALMNTIRKVYSSVATILLVCKTPFLSLLWKCCCTLQICVLMAESLECGFEPRSRPRRLCPWARHFTIIASPPPRSKWVPVRAELVVAFDQPCMRQNGSNWAVYSPGSWDGFRNDLCAWWAGVIMLSAVIPRVRAL